MDATRQMQKARQELTKFTGDRRTKKIEQEKLETEIREDEEKIREIRAIERDMRLKRSRLGRINTEISRLDRQKVRLTREIPIMLGELRRAEEEGGERFRKPL